MCNTATRTTKTTVDKSGLNQLLTDARMQERRARAEVMASRMVIAGGGIKRANQLENTNTEAGCIDTDILDVVFFGELANGFGLCGEVHAFPLVTLQNAELAPGDNRRREHHAPGAVATVRGVVANPYRAGAERVVGERRKVFPLFQAVDHAALQILEREHRRLVVNELAHKQVTEIVDAVFLPELLKVKQRTAPGERILNGDYLPPLAVRTYHASCEGVMTDIDVDPLAGAGAATVK